MTGRFSKLVLGLSVCVALGLGYVACEQLQASPPLPFTFPVPFYGHSARIENARGLGLMILAPGLALALLFSLREESRWRRAAALCLRLGFLLCLAAAASGPSLQRSVDRVCMTAVLDVSSSVSDASIEHARGLIADYHRALQPADSFSLIAFAKDAVRIPVDEQGRISSNTRALRERVKGGATDLARALTLASAEEQAHCVARWVLLTDGLETRGDGVEKMLAQAVSTKIYVEDLSEEMAPDVGVSGLEMPDDVHVGETF